MKILIRFITSNAAGVVQHNDKLIDAPIITIGRATDQILHLRDRRARLQHARIEDRDGAVHIGTSSLSGVIVNGRSQRDTRLVVGDVVEVGANILRVIEPPEGADFACTFELRRDAVSDEMQAAWSADTAADVGISKRRLSWLGVCAILLLAFLLPAAGMLGDGVASLLRGNALLPDDSLWLSGPVHSKHASTNSECQNCHVRAFERVPDNACLQCHTADRHVATSHTSILGSERCASCHLEHNEPPSLVKRHQGLCADCHARPGDGSPLQPVADFLQQHPGFKVSLLQPPASADPAAEWQPVRSVLAEVTESDHSNLKFDHAVHLDSGGIIAPDGKRVVECSDCHVPEPGGAGMLPIAMDEHCVGCHTLSFDPDDPERSVPHGDSDIVLQSLIEYYSARLLGGDPASSEQRVRRPGRALSRAERDKVATQAREKALQVAEDLFERRACVNCHEVTQREDDARLPWQVKPVRLTDSFLPKASFSHAAHDTEVRSCNDCHGAAMSRSAGDVLIPDIQSCRDCHGSAVASRNDAGQTPSTCVMCHSFHYADKGSYP